MNEPDKCSSCGQPVDHIELHAGYGWTPLIGTCQACFLYAMFGGALEPIEPDDFNQIGTITEPRA